MSFIEVNIARTQRAENRVLAQIGTQFRHAAAQRISKKRINAVIRDCSRCSKSRYYEFVRLEHH